MPTWRRPSGRTYVADQPLTPTDLEVPDGTASPLDESVELSRRAIDRELLRLVTVMASDLRAIREAHNELSDRVTLHISNEDSWRAGILAAFPGGAEAHKAYHAEADERAEQLRSVRNAALEKVAVGGVWAAVVFMAIAAWDYIKDHIK